MYPRILLLNGPNLNLLGKREPDIYGHDTLADVEQRSHQLAETLGLQLDCRQSNHEGQLIDWVHEARETCTGLIINPGGYTHTSIALMDALSAFNGPIMEVHISNIHRRETFRHVSYVSRVASGVICGMGIQGYELALQRLATLIKS